MNVSQPAGTDVANRLVGTMHVVPSQAPNEIDDMLAGVRLVWIDLSQYSFVVTEDIWMAVQQLHQPGATARTHAVDQKTMMLATDVELRQAGAKRVNIVGGSGFLLRFDPVADASHRRELLQHSSTSLSAADFR